MYTLPISKYVEFHGEKIYFTDIQEALEHVYRRGRDEGYGEGYLDGKEVAKGYEPITTSKVEVFIRPMCIFNYCPNPKACEKNCIHLVQGQNPLPQDGCRCSLHDGSCPYHSN